MGDISKGIIDGVFCQYCCCLLTESLGSGYGYPVSCLECADKNDEWWKVDYNHPNFKKYLKAGFTYCPWCGKEINLMPGD